MAEPRSAYVMRGDVATQWQHSAAPVRDVRYSITFRTLQCLRLGTLAPD